MDTTTAINILEIDNSWFIMSQLNKKKCLNSQYRKMALKHHPDKNGNTLESTEKFQQINEAYIYLKNNDSTYYSNIYEDDYISMDELLNKNQLFATMLKIVLNSPINIKNITDISKIIYELINNNATNILFKLLDNISKENTIDIYLLFLKYKNTLNITDNLLESIRQYIISRYVNVEIYELNPSITDILLNKIYTLNVNEKIYAVPLWHNVSYFDIPTDVSSNEYNELIVFCVPELPKNVVLDTYNNLIVNVEINIETELQDILTFHKPISFKLGELNYDINPSNLYLKKRQSYCLKNKGVSKQKNDIFDLTDKGDIIVDIVMM